MTKTTTESLIRIVCAAGLALGIGGAPAQAAAAQGYAQLKTVGAPAPDVCFAEYTGDNTADFSSVNGDAVQAAVISATEAALVSSTPAVVKVAGECVGVNYYKGLPKVVAAEYPVTIIGGYTTTNWTTPVAGARTVLDAAGGGQVIYATAAVTLENLVIRNGVANAAAGGGAYLGAGGFISNTEIVSNAVTGSELLSVDGDDGGGVYAAGEIQLVNSVFTENRAANLGGGLKTAPLVTATLINTSFYSNTAGANGGAHLKGPTWISGGVVISNTATGTGSFANGGGLGIVGPGLGRFGRKQRIENVYFARNAALGNAGGGLWAQSNLEIQNCVFEDNYAKGASDGGGGLYAGSDTWATEVIFRRNRVGLDDSAGGGGMYAANELWLSDSLFENNQAYEGAGAEFYLDGEPAYVTNTQFLSNTAAGGWGGAVNVQYGPWEWGGLNFHNVTMTNNSGNQGGALYVQEGWTRITGGLFARNAATETSGGGVYAAYPIEVDGTRFEDNTATAAGGGLYADDELYVDGATFIGNVAPNGAAVNESGITSTVESSTFLSNTASSRGGAYKSSGVGPITLSGNRFEGNTSAKGGALYLGNDGNAALTNNVFAGNEASVGGVDMWLALVGRFDAQHNTFVAKTAGGGEAVQNAMTAGSAILTNSVFAGYAVGVSTVDVVAATLNGVLWDGVTTPTSGTVTVNNAKTGAAGFVDPAAGNYLALGAAFDAGVDSGVATDIRGVARPQGAGYDLGAYEAGNARLVDLAIDPGVLAPAFVSTTMSYTAEVPAGTTSAAVTATTSDVSATVAYASSAGSCDGAVATCAVAAPKTWITATVTAADGQTTLAYSIEIAVANLTGGVSGLSIDPGTLNPAFASSTTSYAANVPNGTSAVTVTAEIYGAADVMYESSAGLCEGPVCAVAGPKTWITVTAMVDGNTAATYVIEITVADANASSDATLMDLTIDPGTLSPAFVSSTTSYAAGVPNGTTSVAVTATPSDANATVAYESSAGACTAPAARGVFPYTCAVAGPKTWITATVTAEDGTAQAYHIEITVAAALTTIDRVWPGTGLPEGGMPVQIFGSGFVAALTVTVGPYEGVMVAVPFTIENDGQIDFVMPAGVAGQRVSVTVQTADDAQTAPNAFTYVQPEMIEFDGETGGVFTTTDGVVVEIPSQGVSGMFVITMTPLPPAPGVPGNILMYSFRLDALLNWVPLASLTNPVTIRLPVDENIFAIADGERPWLYSWTGDGGRRSAVGGRWILVRGQQYDPGTKVMTVALRPMGVYALSTAYLRAYWFPVVPTLR